MPDMIENYMDYSAEDCQNSFTMDQMHFVRWVIRGFRPNIATVSFTEIQEIDEFESLLVAPNPANDIVNFKTSSSAQIKSLKLFNLSGQLVLSQNYNNAKASIATADLPEGIYFVELSANHSTQKIKAGCCALIMVVG
jgi:hypothetical protein